MSVQISFPTQAHEMATETVIEFFDGFAEVDAILSVNSLARGVAVPESDLDFAVLLKPDVTKPRAERIEQSWIKYIHEDPAILSFLRSGRFRKIHLDLFDGRFEPQEWEDGAGPDFFEVEIGNRVAYALPLSGVADYFHQLRQDWLPYYTDDLRVQRLEVVRNGCLYDLDHISQYVHRELHVHAFDILYRALQEFLQVLFISRRLYPLAYNKWIRLQVEEWLGLPEVYETLLSVISARVEEQDELVAKAETLRNLLNRQLERPAS